MFAPIKAIGLIIIGGFIASVDPFIAGIFTMLNTVLITHLNRRNQEQTDTVVSHLQAVIDKLESHRT